MLISVFLLLSHLFSAVEVCCVLQPPLLLSPFPPPKMEKPPSAANDGVQQNCATAGACPGPVGSSPPGPPFSSSSSSSSLPSISSSSSAPSPPSLQPLYISSPPFPCPPIPSVLLSPPFFWLQALHSTWEMQGKMAVPPKTVTKIPAGCLNEHVV